MTTAMERLGDQLVLTGDPAQGRTARRTVRERAAKVVNDDDVLDDIELMTSEAIANALLHGSGPIRLTVTTDGRRVRVGVRDGGPARRDPARRGIDHGRGLSVIDALAAAWALEQAPGETHLWFVVEASDDAPPPAGAAGAGTATPEPDGGA